MRISLGCKGDGDEEGDLYGEGDINWGGGRGRKDGD